MSAKQPTADQLVGWLRHTEARLGAARVVMERREAEVRAMRRADRRSRDGLRAVALAQETRDAVEAMEAVVMGLRHELGEGPEPQHCPHTTAAPDGGRLPCQLGYGHPGPHAHHDRITRRWE